MSKSLVLRVCGAHGESHGAFRWPLEVGATVRAPDWRSTHECGNGLHGWLYGQGDYACTDRWRVKDAKWLVVEVDSDSIIELGGKVKFPACLVRFVGDAKSATDYLWDSEGAMHKTVADLKHDALDSTDLRAWESLATHLEAALVATTKAHEYLSQQHAALAGSVRVVDIPRAVRAALDEAVALYQRRSIEAAGADEEDQALIGAGEAAARMVRTVVLAALAGSVSNVSRPDILKIIEPQCPTCACTDPTHHPAVQEGGEVQLCENAWHQPTAAEIRAREAASVPVVSRPATVPAEATAMLGYLVLTYSDLFREALRDGKPFVEVATGNFQHFLTGLQSLLNGAARADVTPEMDDPGVLRQAAAAVVIGWKDNMTVIEEFNPLVEALRVAINGRLEGFMQRAVDVTPKRQIPTVDVMNRTFDHMERDRVDAERWRWWCKWWCNAKDDSARVNSLEYDGDDPASFGRAVDNAIAADVRDAPPKGRIPKADEDGDCVICGCTFEDGHECPPGFATILPGGER
jgi:hypothetical protein